MADKFFEDQQTEEPIEEAPQTIKLGEKEYTQDELEYLVGLGEVGREAEEKYKIKIDGVWPNLQRTINEKRDLEQKLAELEQSKTTTSQPLTEDLRKQALEQAEALGIGPNSIREAIRTELAAKDLINDVQNVIGKAEDEGNPTTSIDRILSHMQETGIKNPEKAYKDLFEEELDKIKEQKLQSLRPSGMVTTQQSTAGSKQPAPAQPPKNHSELERAVMEALAGN